MTTRILDYDPLTKKLDRFHYNHSDDSFVVSTEMDVTDMVELNKAQLNASDGRFRDEIMNHVARIPPNIYFRLMQQGYTEKDLLKWLDHPDQKAFRTHPGRLSR